MLANEGQPEGGLAGAVSARGAPGHRRCCEAGHCDAFGSPAEAVMDPDTEAEPPGPLRRRETCAGTEEVQGLRWGRSDVRDARPGG